MVTSYFWRLRERETKKIHQNVMNLRFNRKKKHSHTEINLLKLTDFELNR